MSNSGRSVVEGEVTVAERLASSKLESAGEEAMGGGAAADLTVVVVPAEDPPRGISGSPPHRLLHPRAPETESQGPSVLDLSLFAYCGSVMVGILANAKGLVDGWGVVPRASYGVASAAVIASMAVGFMSAGCGASPMAPNRRLSAFCARFGAVATTALLLVAMACKLGGSFGCAGGGVAGAVIALAMAVVWLWSESAAAHYVSSLCGRLRRREEPVLPQ